MKGFSRRVEIPGAKLALQIPLFVMKPIFGKKRHTIEEETLGGLALLIGGMRYEINPRRTGCLLRNSVSAGSGAKESSTSAEIHQSRNTRRETPDPDATLLLGV